MENPRSTRALSGSPLGASIRVSAAALALLAALPAAAETPASFWDQTRRGANSFSRVETTERLAAAKAFGADFVRVAFGKWEPSGRDFLAGDLDDYRGLAADDLAQLKAVLDGAARAGTSVLLAPLDLPGSRWRQNNGDRFDDRLWSDPRWRSVAARYWRDLATALKGHPAIVGYNVLNEPNPEWRQDLADGDPAARQAWCARVRGTPRDLNLLYREVHAAIRAVDPRVPIVFDLGSYGAPLAALCLDPIDDPAALYSAHMYEPYAYTTMRLNGGALRYPGPLPFAGATSHWDRQRIGDHLQPLLEWADRRQLPRNRLMLGEFGCDRRAPGCADYLRDVIAVAEGARIHWAFYAFREDVWDAMDYEIGDGPTPKGYWAAVERGEAPEVARGENPLTSALKDGLQGRLAPPTTP